MNLPVTTWTLTRKTVRRSFSLGQLGLLFSISDRSGGPKLSEQDRRDAAYPYWLGLPVSVGTSGTYRLAQADSPWAAAVANRSWRATAGKSGPQLVTDLTEYERVLWEELAAQGPPTLEF